MKCWVTRDKKVQQRRPEAGGEPSPLEGSGTGQASDFPISVWTLETGVEPEHV